MTSLRLLYIDHFTDRTGRPRYYFRRPKGKRIPLPGLPGSDEFRRAYEDALGTDTTPDRKQRHAEGSIAGVMESYYRSRGFVALRESTKKKVRGVLGRLIEREHPSGLPIGKMPIAKMKRRHVEELLDLQAETPGAANETLKCLRLLIGHSIARELRTTDPTLKIRKSKGKTWRSWTDDEIRRFEAHWPIGTRQRLAFALHLYTGQRRADVAAMTWRDIAGERIHVVQEKTGEKLWIRLHRDLRAILAQTPRAHLSILMTEQGKPFTTAGYGNWMHDAIRGAGLPEECVTHGLRKAAGRRLAEAGCSAKQIMAVLGHRTLTEAERYTRQADQKQLADDAIGALEKTKEG